MEQGGFRAFVHGKVKVVVGTTISIGTERKRKKEKSFWKVECGKNYYGNEISDLLKKCRIRKGSTT